MSAEAQEFKIRGRLHLDAFYGFKDAEEFSNGFNNRRTQIGMAGKLSEKWSGIIEVYLSDAILTMADVMLTRSFENGGKFSIGHYKVPQGLNELTSSNNITFIERSMITNSFVDARRIGFGYDFFKPTFGFSSMIFGRALGQRDRIVNDMPIAGAIRGVFSPKLGGGQLHLGTSAVYEELYSNVKVRYGDRPECRDSKGGSIRYIDVSVDDANSTFKTGFELLYIRGAFSLEGEFIQVLVQRKDDEPVFNGYHIQSSYVLTGESRSYSRGVVGGIVPKGDKPAWEIAVRYSTIDLNDLTYTGGEQSNITFGLNCYLESRIRFMGNIILVNIDAPDKKPVLGVFRVQYHF